MLIRLFNIVLLFLTQPSKAWQQVAEGHGAENDVQSVFIYPFIGIIALSAFVNSVIYAVDINMEVAIKNVIVQSSALFIGYFLAIFALDYIADRFFGVKRILKRMYKFVGYSLVVCLSTFFVSNLIIDFPFIWLALIYTIYVAHEGAVVYLRVDESRQLSFSIVATMVILIFPIALYQLLLTTIMNS